MKYLSDALRHNAVININYPIILILIHSISTDTENTQSLL